MTIPGWLTALAPVFMLLSIFLTAYLTHFFTKDRKKLENREIANKNKEMESRGFEFQQKAFKDAQTFIDNLSEQLNKEKRLNNEKQSTIDILKMENSKMTGKVELALKERDDVLVEVKDIEARFKKEMQTERDECNDKIKALNKEIIGLHEKIVGMEKTENSYGERISSLEQSNISDHNIRDAANEKIAEGIADEKVAEHKEIDHDA
jgi:hypothetical protein